MPNFDKRADELYESFNKEKASFKPGDVVDPPVRLKSLYAARQDALSDMLPPLLDQGLDPKARDVNDKMSALLDRWVLPLSKLTDGMLSPSDELNWWREARVHEEMAFFQGLINMGVGEKRDALAALEVALAKMIADLELKWGTMTAEAQRLEQIESDACKAMSDIVSKGLREGVDAYARYGELFGRLMNAMAKAPDLVNDAVVYAAKEAGLPDEIAVLIPKISLAGKDYFAKGKELGLSASELSKANPELFRDPGMAVSEYVQKALGPEVEAAIGAILLFHKSFTPWLQGEYANQIDKMRDPMPNQGAILVSLSQSRRDVDDFLRNSGLDKAKVMVEEAIDTLDRFAEHVPTDGQKSDAKEWIAGAKEAFRQRFERIANAFGMFVQANQGRFLGSVSKQVENKLINTDVWFDRENGIVGFNMDERLREWRKGTIEVRDRWATASSQVQASLAHLPDDIRAVIATRLDEYWTRVGARLDAENQTAVAEIAKTEESVSDEAIKRSFDRSRLKQAISA